MRDSSLPVKAERRVESGIHLLLKRRNANFQLPQIGCVDILNQVLQRLDDILDREIPLSFFITRP